MRILKVIYFTVVPLVDASNGGNIACRNHVLRLSQDPGIELHVVAAPVPQNVDATRAFLDEIGGEHLVVPRNPHNIYQESLTLSGAIKFALKMSVHFPWEVDALNQTQFDEVLDWGARHWSADVIVIDYLFSALFCPRIIDGPRKTAIITLNREEEFHRDMIRLGLVKHDRLTAEISARRLAAFERDTYRKVDIVIALTENDLPKSIPAKKAASIIPFLDSREKWAYSNTRSMFFVGNIGHYPNREAMEFIATKLAPSVEDIDVRFEIVGASPESVPPEWRHPKVDYLGVSDAETVKRLFTTSDAMLCPINNTYGMKYKIAEAIAHGTPLIANSEALQCVPYLKGLPTFDFIDAPAAARIVRETAGNRGRSEFLSRIILDASTAFIESQSDRWSRVLSAIV